MKKSTYVLAAVLCLAFAAASTHASTINLSTGQNPLGTLSTTDGACDAQWTVVNNNPAGTAGANTPYGCTSPAPPNPAQMVFSGDSDWYGGWVPDGTSNGCTFTGCSSTGSNWVGLNSGYTANGYGTYSVNFSLAGLNLSTVDIAGGWTLDDSGSLYLNGCLIETSGDGGWGSLQAFSITTSSNPGCINAGSNTLMAVIQDTDDYLEGVNVDATVTGSTGSATPEPGSLLLLASGFLGVGGFLRRKLA
jgi:hypothetical protein